MTATGQAARAAYHGHPRQQRDFRPAILRTYLFYLRQFAAWCEQTLQVADDMATFTGAHLTTPTLTAYHAHLQALGLSPAPINNPEIAKVAWGQTTHTMPRMRAPRN